MKFFKACVKPAVLACAAGLLVASSAIGQTTKSETAGPIKTSASEKQLKPQTTCPVMGGDIDTSLYVNYQGERIYVCCQGCLAKLKKNPEKYIKKLEKMGQVPKTIPEEGAK
jgi:YHS domain-containing protein